MNARLARQARADVEAALDARGWPWSLRLSRWLDALRQLEEERLTAANDHEGR